MGRPKKPPAPGDAQKRYRARLGKEKRRQLRQRDEAKCFDMERLMKHVEKQADGCWIWTGSFQIVWQRVRPIIRAGSYGKVPADLVMKCLTTKAPLPPRCFLTTACGRMDCVSPDHLLITNRSVETAKRRLANEQKGFLGQGRAGAGDDGDAGDEQQPRRRTASG